MKISKFQMHKIKIKTTEFCLPPYFEVQMLILQQKNNCKTIKKCKFMNTYSGLDVHKIHDFPELRYPFIQRLNPRSFSLNSAPIFTNSRPSAE
jgi:hypothetical protein